MAPATASDIGRTAAETVFMGNDLRAVVTAIDISRRAQAIAKQNFGMALTYNALAVPLAMLGLVSPLIAAVAMSTSSIVVIANALRLGLVKTGGHQSDTVEPVANAGNDAMRKAA